MTQKEGLLRAIDLELYKFDIENENYFKIYKKIAQLYDINWTEKAILALVLNYIFNKQTFYMSNEVIGEELGMSKSTVIRSIKSLKTKELIKTIKKVKKSSKRIVGRIILLDKSKIDEYCKKQEEEFYYEAY